MSEMNNEHVNTVLNYHMTGLPIGAPTTMLEVKNDEHLSTKKKKVYNTPKPQIYQDGLRRRTYTPWSSKLCPAGKIAVPALPLLQSSPYVDSMHTEFNLSGACVNKKLLYNSKISCSDPGGNMEKVPWVNVEGILKAKGQSYQPKSKGTPTASYQILETIPNYIVQSGSTDLDPGVPTYNMTIKGVKNIEANPEKPYQTHGAFVKELNDCTDSFEMCCMYFTFLSYTCPMCNKFICNTDMLNPENLKKS